MAELHIIVWGIKMLTKEEIQAILISLEAIEVHGFDNMNRLMGCIAYLKQKLEEEKNDA